MSDWQPARIRVFHDLEFITDTISEKDAKEIESRVIRVRPSPPGGAALQQAREKGCESEVFFELHPDDLRGTVYANQKAYACEHQVLTD